MRSKRILIVEPDSMLQTILIYIFTQADYAVCVSVSTDEMLSMLVGFRPEVVMIGGDSRGTFASGWQTASCIANFDPELPLIMLTTNRTVLEEQGQTARGKLFTAGVLKPFDLDELLVTVAACLELPHAQTDISLQRSNATHQNLTT